MKPDVLTPDASAAALNESLSQQLDTVLEAIAHRALGAQDASFGGPLPKPGTHLNVFRISCPWEVRDEVSRYITGHLTRLEEKGIPVFTYAPPEDYSNPLTNGMSNQPVYNDLAARVGLKWRYAKTDGRLNDMDPLHPQVGSQFYKELSQHPRKGVFIFRSFPYASSGVIQAQLAQINNSIVRRRKKREMDATVDGRIRRLEDVLAPLAVSCGRLNGVVVLIDDPRVVYVNSQLRLPEQEITVSL